MDLLIIIKIKRCTDCGRFLGENNFTWQTSEKRCRRSYCRKCASNRSYLWVLSNKEYVKKRDKKYRKNNRERRNKQSKQWREYNKEHTKEYDKQWYKSNREYKKEYARQYRKENPEYHKQYNQNNRDKRSILKAKRKIAEQNQTITLTNIEKNKVGFIYKVASTMVDCVVDHIQPISKGGSNHPDNLQILTIKLNAEKAAKWPLTPEEEIKYKGFRL